MRSSARVREALGAVAVHDGLARQARRRRGLALAKRSPVRARSVLDCGERLVDRLLAHVGRSLALDAGPLGRPFRRLLALHFGGRLEVQGLPGLGRSRRVARLVGRELRRGAPELLGRAEDWFDVAGGLGGGDRVVGGQHPIEHAPDLGGDGGPQVADCPVDAEQPGAQAREGPLQLHARGLALPHVLLAPLRQLLVLGRGEAALVGGAELLADGAVVVDELPLRRRPRALVERGHAIVQVPHRLERPMEPLVDEARGVGVGEQPNRRLAGGPEGD